MGFTSNTSLAGIFALDSSSHLFEPSTNLYPNTDDGGLYYVYAETAATVDTEGYLYLSCEIDQGGMGCTARNGGDTFYWCPVIGPPDALVFGNEGSREVAGGGDCVALKVEVDCVG